MNDAPDRPGGEIAHAEHELARLNGRVEAMRSVLIRLLQDVVQAESRLDNSQAAQLLEANEQLVVTALGAQADSETAAQALDDVSRSAAHDPLTDLPNRALLLDRLGHAIANAKRNRTRAALLFLDLNGFKQINDRFGHAVGDRALQLAAQCLASVVRETDTVSRHGGDEFLILLAQVSRAADAALIAEKVITALAAHSRIGEHEVHLIPSIGISLYPDDGEDPQTLIDRADAAMYLAKRHERAAFVFHGVRAPDASASPAPPLDPQQQGLADHAMALAEHERRHAQLREANEQLVLAALSAQELQAAAEQAQRQQTEFLARVANELNDPLAPIRIATAMLGRLRTDEPLLPRAQAIIERQMGQISRLIGDLLDPTRVRKGTLTLERRVFDLAEVIDDAIHVCRPALDRRAQTFEVDVPRGPLEMEGDPARLAQVLTNLLTNATTYTQDGGKVRLSVEADADAMVITVSDSGIGITAEALPTILEPFVQDTHAVGFNGGGLGIGLTVVREIVEAHSGSVVASSAGRGLGSRFVVTLPRAPGKPA